MKKRIKKEKKKKFTFKNVLLVILSFGAFCLISLFMLGIYIVLTAPKFSEENLYKKEATILYDKDGNIYAKLGANIREKVTYDDLSESLIDAIIATEDSRFFQHSGVDLPRFLKATASQLIGHGGGGASTITMQVSKNSYTSNESEGIKGIIRKLTDIYISVFKIEKNYTKEEIFEFYINSYNMGNGNWGVEQASQNYFGKSASDLNIAESALIAGLFQAPSYYNPHVHPDACESRRQTVLYLMLRHGYINQEEYDIAKELSVDKIVLKSSETQEHQSFIDTVVSEVKKRTGKDPYEVPMEIYTTMNPTMQSHINKIYSGETFKWINDTIQSGSIVIDVNTGEINAVGASHNRKGANTLNFATDIKRQIGSTAKAFYDYGPGIEYNNWSTYKTFVDEPSAYSDGTEINNWDRKYLGLISLHDSLKKSRNIPALEAFREVNNKNSKEFALNLGLSPEIKNGYIHEAHSIGGYDGESPLTVANAYAAFSNGGYYIEAHSFTSLTYRETGEQYIVKPIKRRVMSEETAYMITKVLEDTSSYAIALGINGVNYCAKTGTSNYDYATMKALNLPSNSVHDRWVIGYNDTYSIALWYGYENNSSEYYLTTSSTAQKYLLQAIGKGVFTKKSTWEKPDGVVEVEVELGLDEAKLASEFTPNNLKGKYYFKVGTEPTEISDRFSKLNNVTNLDYDSTTKILSWEPVKTPNAIDSNYLENYFNSLFSVDKYKQQYLNERLDYNKNYIGTINYEIYTKDADGNLTLIATTPNTQYSYNLSNNTTFVVKTAYTIFKDNRSDGAELTVDSGNVALISAHLNGNNTVNVLINGTYNEPIKPVTVLDNFVDVTNNAVITTTIRKTSTGKLLNSIEEIDTSIIDTYTISYHIKYNDYNETLVRVIEIFDLEG